MHHQILDNSILLHIQKKFEMTLKMEMTIEKYM